MNVFCIIRTIVFWYLQKILLQCFYKIDGNGWFLFWTRPQFLFGAEVIELILKSRLVNCLVFQSVPFFLYPKISISFGFQIYTIKTSHSLLQHKMHEYIPTLTYASSFSPLHLSMCHLFEMSFKKLDGLISF